MKKVGHLADYIERITTLLLAGTRTKFTATGQKSNRPYFFGPFGLQERLLTAPDDLISLEFVVFDVSPHFVGHLVITTSPS